MAGAQHSTRWGDEGQARPLAAASKSSPSRRETSTQGASCARGSNQFYLKAHGRGPSAKSINGEVGREANLERQKANWWLPGARGENRQGQQMGTRELPEVMEMSPDWIVVAHLCIFTEEY